MKKTFNDQWVIGKVHHFGDRIFKNKNLFVFGQDRFFKAIKSRECISNDIVFTRNEVYVWVELFDKIEPANEAVRSGVVSCDVEVISVHMEHCAQEHGAKLSKDHDNRKEFFITNSVLLLGVIEFA